MHTLHTLEQLAKRNGQKQGGEKVYASGNQRFPKPEGDLFLAQVIRVGSQLFCRVWSDRFIFLFQLFMVFSILPKLSVGVNEKIEGAYILCEAKAAYDDGKYAADKQAVDDPVYKNLATAKNQIKGCDSRTQQKIVSEAFCR